MTNLQLYQRLAVGTGFISNLTRHAPGWRRTTRAKGGYYLGDFHITGETATPVEMGAFFTSNIGRVIKEKTASMTTWEGEIVEMDLTIGGITWRITLNPERFQNKVNVYYTDATTGIQGSSGWSEDTDSSDIYGESQYIEVVGKHYDSTVATARRDRRLIEFAYPQSIPVGDLRRAAEGVNDALLAIRCAGLWHGINRRYQTADIAAANLSAQISTLVGYSEFVAAGRIETNTLSVPIKCATQPRRLWDLISELIGIGDAAGDRWVGGCYEGKKFNYAEAQQTVDHYWDNGQLVDKSRSPVIPSVIKPDMVVQLASLLPGDTPPGGNVWDSPRNVWIEEVEFSAPGQYRLIPYRGSAL